MRFRVFRAPLRCFLLDVAHESVRRQVEKPRHRLFNLLS